MTRFEYERKFETYPDLLTIGQFCAMLGGIADSTARRLLQQGLVEHFMIRTTYYIPKIRAMEIIDELERSARGLYTGSIGYFSDNGDCDLNIVIRTAVWQDGCYRIGVGGGITYESDPAFEYQETLDKARAVLAAVAGGEAR